MQATPSRENNGRAAGLQLRRDLPRLPMPLVLVVGEGDRTIPPGDALRLRSVLRTVEVVRLPGLGHLAHEERPEARKLDRCGLPER